MSDRIREASDEPVPFLLFGPRPDRTTYEGWQEFRRTRDLFVPVKKTSLAEYQLMSPRKRSLHDLHRVATHVNMRLEETPMSAAVTAPLGARVRRRGCQPAAAAPTRNLANSALRTWSWKLPAPHWIETASLLLRF
jgi:hypothetical protein